MTDVLKEIFNDIKDDPMNKDFTDRGIDPLYSADKNATIMIVGQAPGQKAEASRMYWNDQSGDRLRDWIGVSREKFYSTDKIAILPMDFYFPGMGKSGDLPPRKGFAEKWHPKLIEQMPNLELIILVGSYAVHHYLNLKTSVKLTDIVRDYNHYLPRYFPLVHPSPRNQIWMRKNPWFDTDVLPVLKEHVHKLM
ncbi:uracil-DNA glycosylase family protein [Vagococcus vulneris]|uniref:Uracil-DNA glycosylase n=1 Tax=Vagococcus vulneris TaxID=1977869 RepID=A0A430A250_9ENTE|nr:uracil-DNA glycosylase family protein [Vagococcus vulneris]RSU00539.1 uracil-DNA glycosylase [Vagococcus vulneris]